MSRFTVPRRTKVLALVLVACGAVVCFALGATVADEHDSNAWIALGLVFSAVLTSVGVLALTGRVESWVRRRRNDVRTTE